MNTPDRRPFAVLCPMESEFHLLRDALKDSTTVFHGNYEFCRGTVNGYPVVVIRCLIGMVNAAAAALLCAEYEHPRAILIQGTAGAHDPELHRRDLVLGEHLVELGYFITGRLPVGAGCDPTQWVCPGKQMRRDGKIQQVHVLHGDKYLLDAAKRVPYLHGRVKVGTIGSADIWNRELDRIALCREKYGTDCEEMEGFAVAQIAEQYQIPMLNVRVISNNEWHPAEEFNEDVADLCQEFCLDLLRLLIAEARR